MITALDAGAEDLAEDEDGTTIYTAQGDLFKVKEALAAAGVEIDSAELQYIAANGTEVSEEDAPKLEKLLDALDDLDDVVAVHTSAK